DGDSNNVLFNFMAYDPNYTGGVRVAAGDVNGDGFADIITAPGPGGGPDIHVYDGRTGGLMRQFFAFNPLFTGGAYIAAGDVNGLLSFFAYDQRVTNGLFIAAGDINGDGFADVITGPGPQRPTLVTLQGLVLDPSVNIGPNVAVFSGIDGSRLKGYFAYDPA